MPKHFLTRIFYDAYKPSWDKTDIYTPKEVAEVSERISKKIAKTQKRLQGKAPYSCDALQDILDYLGTEKAAVVNRTLFSSEMSDINDPNKMNSYAHILSCMNITFNANKNEFWQKAITVVLGTLDPDVLLNTETWNLSSYIDAGHELQMIILVFQYCFERTKDNIDNLPFDIFDEDYDEDNDEEYDEEYDDDDEYDEDEDDEIAAIFDLAVKKQASQQVPSEHPDTQINYPKLTSMIRSAINQEAEIIQEQLKGLTSAVQNEIEKKEKQIADKSAIIEKLQTEAAKKASETKRLYHDLDFYIERVNLLQQELSCYEDLVGTTNETERKEENNEPVPFEETEIGIADSKEQIPEIPEDSSVQFIGGHINMINKLKLVHPDWTYVSDDTSGPSPTFNPRKKLTCVIIYSTHMSHSLFDSVYDKVPKDVPVLYVTAVNLDLLEAQIHASWDKEQIRLREMKKTEQRQEIST